MEYFLNTVLPINIEDPNEYHNFFSLEEKLFFNFTFSSKNVKDLGLITTTFNFCLSTLDLSLAITTTNTYNTILLCRVWTVLVFAIYILLSGFNKMFFTSVILITQPLSVVFCAFVITIVQSFIILKNVIKSYSCRSSENR